MSSDSKLDFDFSGISGKKKKKAAEEKPVKKKEIVTGRTEDMTGIVLTIGTEVPGEYLSKDLAECSGEDFLAWSTKVHLPGDMPPPEKLQSKMAKLRIFKQILHYHTQHLFPTKDHKPSTEPN